MKRNPAARTEVTAPKGRRSLRLPETERITGYCDMQLRRMEKDGTFPKRFKLNPNGGAFGAVGWDSLEVEQWLAARRASREEVAA